MRWCEPILLLTLQLLSWHLIHRKYVLICLVWQSFLCEKRLVILWCVQRHSETHISCCWWLERNSDPRVAISWRLSWVFESQGPLRVEQLFFLLLLLENHFTALSDGFRFCWPLTLDQCDLVLSTSWVSTRQLELLLKLEAEQVHILQ